jgi:small subunit ribosomal protein S2
LAEARRLNITTFGIVDTNSDPTQVDFPIPANDDASKSIAIITNYLVDAIIEGLQERQKDKDELEASKEEVETIEETERKRYEQDLIEEDEVGRKKGGDGKIKQGRPASLHSGEGRRKGNMRSSRSGTKR